MPNWSSAVTVKGTGKPAVVVADADTMKCVAAAGLTAKDADAPMPVPPFVELTAPVVLR